MSDTVMIIVIGQAFVIVGKIIFDWLKSSKNGKNGTMINGRIDKLIDINEKHYEKFIEFSAKQLSQNDSIIRELSDQRNEISKLRTGG